MITSWMADNWHQLFFGIFCLAVFIQLIYQLYFFSRVGNYKSKNKTRTQTHPVSIIICTRDNAEQLARNIPGVLVQKFSTTHEVIVVNHNSQDDTPYLLEEFKKTFKDLKIVNLKQDAVGIPGKKYPLSVGIKEARFEVLLLTDADCVPASEFWLEKMQEGYDEAIEIVIGYGAYHKRKGFLNKLIRFETFHSALQFLSFAIAGIPYMGVGRNLSYKKSLFFNNKGFSSLNHLPGGDDDLFINKVANKKNTAVVIDQEAFTYSEPKKTFKEWFIQKKRHFSTAKYYRPKHKFLLGSYSISHFLIYPFFIAAFFFTHWIPVLSVMVFRIILQSFIYYKAMNKLDEKDLFKFWLIFDIWMFIYYLIFAPALWRKPTKNWN